MSVEQTSLTTTLIGTLIRWPALMDRAVRIVRSPDYFVKQEYRDMYGTLLDMYVNGAPISEETYAAALSEKWGGERASIVTYSLGYHSKTDTSTPADFVEWACTTIANRYKLRQLRDLGKKIELQASSTTTDPQALLTMMSDAIHEVDNQADDAVRIGKIAEEYWEQLVSGESEDGYIPTPDPNINHLIGGLYYGDMHMIIGRPSDGKTSLALPFVRHAAKLNKRGIYFALDETKRSMLQRCISMDTGLSRGDMRKSVMNEEKERQINEAINRIMREPWSVVDRGGLSMVEVSALCRAEKRSNGLDLVVIDYAQQVVVPGRVENQNIAMTKVSNAMKVLAKELNVALVVCAQLVKIHEDNKRPKLEHIRDTGTWAQDANLVMSVWRQAKNSDRGWIDVLKQKQGPTGSVEALFDLKRSIWKPLAKTVGQEPVEGMPF